MAIELLKHAKGARPHFFSDPSVDKLLAMLMALVAEVSVSHDRMDTLERLLEQKGLLKRADLDQYRPTADVLGERDQWRREYLRQILRIVDVDAVGTRNDTSREWQEIIDTVTE